MRNQETFEYEDEDFKSYQYENIGVIKIKKNVFEIITDLSERNELLTVFNIAAFDQNIDALLFLNSPGCFSEEEYDNYMQELLDHGVNEDQYKESKNIGTANLRAIKINVLNTFVTKIMGFDKVVVVGFCGSIVTPFFGASLAADLRYGSENMYFSLTHLKHGMHPSGALPFFLPKYIGQAKATEFLLKCSTINAEEAFRLNLITEILPENNFENLCIQKVCDLTKSNSAIINRTRRLLHNYGAELEKYLEKEDRIIYI